MVRVINCIRFFETTSPRAANTLFKHSRSRHSFCIHSNRHFTYSGHRCSLSIRFDRSAAPAIGQGKHRLLHHLICIFFFFFFFHFFFFCFLASFCPFTSNSLLFLIGLRHFHFHFCRSLNSFFSFVLRLHSLQMHLVAVCISNFYRNFHLLPLCTRFGSTFVHGHTLKRTGSAGCRYNIRRFCSLSFVRCTHTSFLHRLPFRSFFFFFWPVSFSQRIKSSNRKRPETEKAFPALQFRTEKRTF